MSPWGSRGRHPSAGLGTGWIFRGSGGDFHLQCCGVNGSDGESGCCFNAKEFRLFLQTISKNQMGPGILHCCMQRPWEQRVTVCSELRVSLKEMV